MNRFKISIPKQNRDLRVTQTPEGQLVVFDQYSPFIAAHIDIPEGWGWSFNADDEDVEDGEIEIVVEQGKPSMI
jgi:hypothetical protein